MRVAVFRDLVAENWPSMETYADGLVGGLRSLGAPDLDLREIRPGCPWLPFGRVASVYLSRSVLYPIRARAAQGEVNHIIDHSYAHLVHFVDRRRTVVTCHDLVPLVLRPSQEGLPHYGLSLWLWDWAFSGLEKAARIIADSESTRRDLLRFSGRDPDSVSVVPAGVAPYFRRLDDEAALRDAAQRFGVGPEPVVLHVSHCAPRKNVEGLIRALGLLAVDHRFVFLQIGGSFSQAQRQLVAASGLADRVRQYSKVSRDDLVRLYNLATVFVFPSSYEGFGLPVLEAMACGTPVVCSNASSVPEVAGDAALLVAPEDTKGLAAAIGRLLGDEGLRRELAAKGLVRASAFTWERCAAATLEVYRELYKEVCA